MSKMHEGRFTLKFDSDNPIHFNAISILNEKGRNKANYIAELIWEKEFCKEQEKNDSLKNLIKEALLEVIKENKFLFATSVKDNKENDEEIVLSEKKPTNTIAGSFNKELMQGLSAFGIKPK